MARRNRAVKRLIVPDVKYNSELVARFINKLMASGKKTVAASVFYEALDIAGNRAKKPGIEVFEQAVKNATPLDRGSAPASWWGYLSDSVGSASGSSSEFGDSLAG